MKNKQAKK